MIVYIDGFNLYFALRAKGWKKYYWLDLIGLSRRLLKPEQQLMEVHYFTSRIRYQHGNRGTMRRQETYLEALSTLEPLQLHFGHYLEKSRRCRRCKATWVDFEEKMTDVNIATQLLADAFDDDFDTALLISADSDLTMPVQLILRRFPNKRIVVVCPPGRNSAKLTLAASAHFTLGHANLRHSMLPDTVLHKSGRIVRRPNNWR